MASEINYRTALFLQSVRASIPEKKNRRRVPTDHGTVELDVGWKTVHMVWLDTTGEAPVLHKFKGNIHKACVTLAALNPQI